jgi:hypothetical protein
VKGVEGEVVEVEVEGEYNPITPPCQRVPVKETS